MKRRKAIVSIFLLSAGVAATYTGFKAFHIYKTPDWKFLDNCVNMMEELAEILIPETDTPGAKAAAVGPVMKMLVKNAIKRTDQNNFIEGLKATQQYCIKEFNKDIDALNNSEKKKLMQKIFDDDDEWNGLIGKVKRKLTGHSYFSLLREYSSIAFCTSQLGAEKALSYDHVPGRYFPCIPLENGQHSWATK